jgi:hypothetical protein
LLLLAACGSGASEAPENAKVRAPLENVVEDSSGRVVVAKVNAVPVYADCVQRQAQAHHLSRAEALDECINFELLAQAAHKPEYLLTPEVQEPATQELVRAYVAASFKGSRAEDIPDEIVQQLWKEVNRFRYNRPEARDIVFCRVEMPEGASVSSDEYQKARAFFTKLYNELKTRTDLTETDLFMACYGDPEAPETELRPFQRAGIETLTLNTFNPQPRNRYDSAFREHLFDGPQAAGMVTPPLYTRFGWDLILLTEIFPAIATEFAEAEPELRKALAEEPVYEPQRAAIFNAWYAPLEAKHKVTRSFELLPTDTSPLVPFAPTDSTPPAGPPGVPR